MRKCFIAGAKTSFIRILFVVIFAVMLPLVVRGERAPASGESSYSELFYTHLYQIGHEFPYCSAGMEANSFAEGFLYIPDQILLVRLNFVTACGPRFSAKR
jgi:hypothetical protein